MLDDASADFREIFDEKRHRLISDDIGCADGVHEVYRVAWNILD